jgi:hypothetical protein
MPIAKSVSNHAINEVAAAANPNPKPGLRNEKQQEGGQFHWNQ